MNRTFLRAAAALAVIACSFAIVGAGDEAWAQPVPGGLCRPVSERTNEVGCWIIAHESVGQLTDSPTFWYLDTYPTHVLILHDASKPATTMTDDWTPKGLCNSR